MPFPDKKISQIILARRQAPSGQTEELAPQMGQGPDPECIEFSSQLLSAFEAKDPESIARVFQSYVTYLVDKYEMSEDMMEETEM